MSDSTQSHAVRLLVATIGLAAFAAAMWFAWLGWDHEYYLVDGIPQGPYRAWQVIGCGAAILLATVATYVWVRGTLAIFMLSAAAALGFAVPWTIDAAATDDSGLFVIGLIMLLVLAGGGLLLVLTFTWVVLGLRGGRTPSQG